MSVPGGGELYPVLLGAAWAELPLVVRRLHQNVSARGRVTIEHGRGWPARLLARLLGFPPAGNEVPTRLEVARGDGEQVWSRRFGEHTMVSRQRLGPSNLLAERFGSFECWFRLRATTAGIDYDLTGTSLVLGGLRLRLPRALAPHVRARTWAANDAMGLDVSISAPLFGRLLRYHGVVSPEADEART
jgi:hypothetical protein